MRARRSGGTPGPESATASSTVPSAAVAPSATSPPEGAASAALARSPRSTWQIRSESARIAGSAAGSSRRTRSAFPASSSWARSRARSKRSCTETAVGSTRSGRAKARSDVTTLPSRSISAVIKAYARCASSSPAGSDSASPWAAERITARGLRTSCATAAASCPRAASFSLWASRARVVAMASDCVLIVSAARRSRRRASTRRPIRKPRSANDEPKKRATSQPTSRPFIWNVTPSAAMVAVSEMARTMPAAAPHQRARSNRSRVVMSAGARKSRTDCPATQGRAATVLGPWPGRSGRCGRATVPPGAGMPVRGGGAGTVRGARPARREEHMNAKQLGILVLLVDFLGLEAYAVWRYGYVGVFELLFANAATAVAFTDLCIALGLVMLWMWQDARGRGTSILPYVVLTLGLGSVGPLLYLLVREASVPRRALVAARA